MEFNTYDRRTIRATRSQQPATLSNLERVLHRAACDVGAKSRSYNTELTEPSVTAGKEAAPYSMKRILEVHTVIHSAKNMAGTVVDSDSDATGHKSKPP